MTHKPLWKASEYKRAMEFIARGHSTASAAAFIGRPPGQLREKIRWEKMSPEKRDHLRMATNRRRSNKYQSTARAESVVSTSRRPSPEMLAEASIRINAPRTLSQELCGDPPPGYSALDRKRQGLAV